MVSSSRSHRVAALAHRRRPSRRSDARIRRAETSAAWTGPSVLARCRAKSSSSSLSLVLVDLGQVGTQVAPDQPAYVVLGQRLLPPDQGQRGGEPLQVPREVAEVGLVEVVDVEDQESVGVQVGAEVLDVQVPVDPDPAARLVRERVLGAGDVGVEDAGAASVERVRVRRHGAELARGTPPGRPPSGARRRPRASRRSGPARSRSRRCFARVAIPRLCPNAESAYSARSRVRRAVWATRRPPRGFSA